MLTTNDEVLRVASLRGRNSATNVKNGATKGATATQPISLKALAIAALTRNEARNEGATSLEKDAQQMGEKSGCFVACQKFDSHPLTDADLSRLIVGTAQAHGVEPLAVWRWLDVGDIEAFRAGDRDHIAALSPCVASAVALGQLTPSGHALTPPPGLESVTTGATGSRRAMPTAEVVMVRCGDCGHFQRDQIGDGSGIGGCAVNAPVKSARYPAIERRCNQFTRAEGRA